MTNTNTAIRLIGLMMGSYRKQRIVLICLLSYQVNLYVEIIYNAVLRFLIDMRAKCFCAIHVDGWSWFLARGKRGHKKPCYCTMRVSAKYNRPTLWQVLLKSYRMLKS